MFGTSSMSKFLFALIRASTNRMLSTGAEFERRAVELFNVPVQTQDLSAYMLTGQPLELMVQPLTPQQVDDYLVRGGEPLSALQVALHEDAALRELARSSRLIRRWSASLEFPRAYPSTAGTIRGL